MIVDQVGQAKLIRLSGQHLRNELRNVEAAIYKTITTFQKDCFDVGGNPKRPPEIKKVVHTTQVIEVLSPPAYKFSNLKKHRNIALSDNNTSQMSLSPPVETSACRTECVW